MKRLIILTMIAIIAIFTLNVDAKTRRANNDNTSIPFEKLVDLIAAGAQEKESNLSKLGLKKLYKWKKRTEYGSDILFIYGSNAKVSKKNVDLIATGRHAFAVEFAGSTDNMTTLFFKEKIDYDAFLKCARKSKKHRLYDDGFESIGFSNFDGNEHIDGWYIIYFHM